jgi:preprotein translocase subunit SecG
MTINLDTGTIVVIVVIALFYLRVVLLQRGKKNQMRQLAGKSRRAIKRAAEKRKADPLGMKQGIQVVSWYLVAASIAIILGGFVLHTSELSFKDWWWGIMSVGIILLGVSIY